MANTIIKVENLGKKYVIGEKQAYYSLRDSISNIFSGKKKKNEEFWALKDINFEIKQGESVGIIGRNGAGKSTLLKILSRITPPTTGKITLHGRVASLLEVGTGFNQELTGRENIYLNGAILGMSRAEIKRKFDEIVAFSEVEKFLDMPVKHYSSGMYMRLAFAVAAHLESEILIVDEVLAVGDAQFQKKCLGKMNEVARKEGRTVLFVSHNMGAVKQLCSKSIFLKSGQVKMIGETSKVISKYLSTNDQKVINIFLSKQIAREGDGRIRITRIYFKNSDNEIVGSFSCGAEVNICFEFEVFDVSITEFNVGLNFIEPFAQCPIAYIATYFKRVKIFTNTNKFTIKIKNIPFTLGVYQFEIFIYDNDGQRFDEIQVMDALRIDAGDYYDTGLMPPINRGACLLDYEFTQ